MSRFLFALLVLGFGLGTILAADEVKVELKDFKWKGKEAGRTSADTTRVRTASTSTRNGSAIGDVTIPEDGEYKLTIDASCTEAMKEFAKFKLSVGDVVVAKEHACTAEDQKKYEFTAKLKKGKHPLAIEFLNDVYKEGEYDRNLFVYSVKIEKK